MNNEWNTLCKERSEFMRERIAAEDERILQLEKNNTKLSELSIQLGELLKYQQEQLNQQDERLIRLEQNPKKITDLIRSAFISAAVSGITAYIFAQIF